MEAMKFGKIDYGIDAPGLVQTFVVVGGVALMTLIGLIVKVANPSALLIALQSVIGSVSFYCLSMVSFMIFYSRWQKVKDREKLLDLVTWNGTETVLDVGCGRGLMLVGAAKRLSSGKCIGIDLWIQKDQSDNSAAGALQNAKLEGVLDRVEVKTADMRELPFADQSFEVVTSSWVVHNLDNVKDRQKAIAEMLRVLKPNGFLILADIVNRDEYEACLQSFAVIDIQRTDYVFGRSILEKVSFGSFSPSAITARKCAD